MEPTKCFPLTLFRKLQSEEGCVSLKKIQEESPCVVDEVAQQFLQTFGQQPLTSQAAQAALQLFLSVTSTETVSVEWGHGTVHRLITSLKTQTHVPSMEYINSQFLAQKYVARAQKARDIGRSLSQRKRQQRPAQSYRAFVTLATRGQQDRPHLEAVARDYEEQKREQSPLYLQSVRLGQIGTALRQRTGGPAFGPSTRQLARKRKARLAQSRAEESASGAPASVIKLPEQGSPAVAVASDSLATVVGVARAVAKRLAKEKGEQREQMWKVLEEFRRNHKTTILQDVFSLLPNLEALQSSFRALPLRGQRSLEVCFHSLPQAAVVAGFAAKTSRYSNMQKALQTSWTHRNRVIMEDGASFAAPPRPKSRACQTQGFCTCSAEGKVVKSYKNQCMSILKELCPKEKQEGRGLLMQGGIVLFLAPHSAGGRESAELSAAAADFLDEIDAGEVGILWTLFGSMLDCIT